MTVRAEVGGFRIVATSFPPLLKLAAHHHERACLTIVLGGMVEKTFARVRHQLAAPGAVAMPPSESHRARFGQSGVQVVMIEPLGDLTPALGHTSRLFTSVQPLADPGLASIAWRMRSELVRPDSITPLALTGLAFELVASAARQTQERGPRPAWISVAEDYLRAHFAEPVALAALARAVGQPAGRVARQFTTFVGVPPGAYVRRLRIHWALRELTRRERSLTEIALGAGFADQSHFSRTFKRQIGTSPGRFRARLET